jgi:hypothetical protein
MEKQVNSPQKEQSMLQDNFGPEAQGKNAASPPPFNLGASAGPPQGNPQEKRVEDQENEQSSQSSTAAEPVSSSTSPTADGPALSNEANVSDQLGTDSISAVAVTFSAVRGTFTPTGSPDRIPPRVDTPVVINVAGWHPPMNFITLTVEGGNTNNGTASIDGGSSAQITQSGALNLRGLTQTMPGNAGNLRIVAQIGNRVVGRSASFSVSTIQKDVRVALQSEFTDANPSTAGRTRGIGVNTFWGADSGNTADLDQLDFSEQVQYDPGTGDFGSISASNSGYLPAITQPLVDSHGTDPGFTQPSTLVAHQTFTQNDLRTGATDLLVANSGFNISRNVVQVSPGVFDLTTSNTPAATSANGFASSAGSGGATSTAQRV